jgi:hypothetical protein
MLVGWFFGGAAYHTLGQKMVIAGWKDSPNRAEWLLLPIIPSPNVKLGVPVSY